MFTRRRKNALHLDIYGKNVKLKGSPFYLYAIYDVQFSTDFQTAFLWNFSEGTLLSKAVPPFVPNFCGWNIACEFFVSLESWK